MKSRVTVLLPVHNGMPYIADALQSLFDQTEKDILICVLDDASTDNTAEYVENLCMDTIKLFRFDKIGLPAILNKGLDLVETEYIARMDSDDICYPERIEKQVQYLEAHPDCVLVGSGIHYISEDGKRKSWSVKVPPTHYDIMRNMMMRRSVLFHPTIVCRTDAMRKCGGYDPDSFPAEDYDLYFRISRYGSLANLTTPLLNMRINSRSVVSQNFVKSLNTYSTIIQKYSPVQSKRHFKYFSIIDNYSALIYRQGLHHFLNASRFVGILYFAISVLINPLRLVQFFYRRLFLW